MNQPQGQAFSARGVHINESASAFLNFLRFILAEIVLLFHAQAFFLKDLWPANLPYLQSMAVTFFFIISGFFTGYTCYNKKLTQKEGEQIPPYSFGDFFVDRFSRIYPAYLLALLAVVAIDSLSLYITHAPYAFGNFDVRSFFATLFMLQNFPFLQNVLELNVFSTARPLWTMAIVWWCYLLFGLLALSYTRCKKKPLYWVAVAVCAIYPVYNAVTDINPGKAVGCGISFAFLMGVLIFYAYKLIKERALRCPIQNRLLLHLALLALLALAFLRCCYTHNQFATDYDAMYTFIVSAFMLLGLWAHEDGVLHIRRGGKFFSFAAGYSYSLFLTHYSFVCLFRRLFAGRLVLGYVVCVIVANGFAILFSLPAERLLPHVCKKWLRALLHGRRGASTST